MQIAQKLQTYSIGASMYAVVRGIETCFQQVS